MLIGRACHVIGQTVEMQRRCSLIVACMLGMTACTSGSETGDRRTPTGPRAETFVAGDEPTPIEPPPESAMAGSFEIREEGLRRLTVRPGAQNYGSCWSFEVWDGAAWAAVTESASDLDYRLFPNSPTARLVPFDDQCLDDEKGGGDFSFDIPEELLSEVPYSQYWVRVCERRGLQQCATPIMLTELE